MHWKRRGFRKNTVLPLLGKYCNTSFFLLSYLIFVNSTFQLFAQLIPSQTAQKDTIKQTPTTRERVVRVYLIEDKNPIKQVLNFDFSNIKKEKDSMHIVACSSTTDSISNPTIDKLQEVFQMVFSGNADFILKFDSAILNTQTKILISDAIKNPLRWRNMDKNAIGGGIFIKKQPEQ